MGSVLGSIFGIDHVSSSFGNGISSSACKVHLQCPFQIGQSGAESDNFLRSPFLQKGEEDVNRVDDCDDVDAELATSIGRLVTEYSATLTASDKSLASSSSEGLESR